MADLNKLDITLDNEIIQEAKENSPLLYQDEISQVATQMVDRMEAVGVHVELSSVIKYIRHKIGRAMSELYPWIERDPDPTTDTAFGCWRDKTGRLRVWYDKNCRLGYSAISRDGTMHTYPEGTAIGVTEFYKIVPREQFIKIVQAFGQEWKICWYWSHSCIPKSFPTVEEERAEAEQNDRFARMTKRRRLEEEAEEAAAKHAWPPATPEEIKTAVAACSEFMGRDMSVEEVVSTSLGLEGWARACDNF